MKRATILLLTSVFVGPGFLLAQEVDLKALTELSTVDASRLDTLRTRGLVAHGTPEFRIAIREQLKTRLRDAVDAAGISRLSLALTPVCDESCVLLLASKLSPEQPAAVTASICRSIGRMLADQTAIQPTNLKYVADQLQTIASDDTTYSVTVIKAAVTAIATTGSGSLDRLVKLKDEARNGTVADIFYHALGETGDVRALPLLRAAFSDSTVDEGKRMQASRAIEQLVLRARAAQTQLPNGEESLCREVLRSALMDSSRGQLFEVAMQVLATVDSSDTTLHSAIGGSLASANPSRREAAVQALFTMDLPLSADTVKFVARLSESDPDEGVRATAQAVVDKLNATGTN